MRRIAVVVFATVAVMLLSGCVSGATKPASPGTRPASTLIDLNTATAAQLQTLPGITAAYAQRIITHRPYKVKHELETRQILPPAVYKRIREKVIATER